MCIFSAGFLPVMHSDGCIPVVLLVHFGQVAAWLSVRHNQCCGQGCTSLLVLTGGPLGWLYPSEIQPLETRSAGQGIATLVNLLFSFIIGQTYLSMLCAMKVILRFAMYTKHISASKGLCSQSQYLMLLIIQMPSHTHSSHICDHPLSTHGVALHANTTYFVV